MGCVLHWSSSHLNSWVCHTSTSKHFRDLHGLLAVPPNPSHSTSIFFNCQCQSLQFYTLEFLHMARTLPPVLYSTPPLHTIPTLYWPPSHTVLSHTLPILHCSLTVYFHNDPSSSLCPSQAFFELPPPCSTVTCICVVWEPTANCLGDRSLPVPQPTLTRCFLIPTEQMGTGCDGSLILFPFLDNIYIFIVTSPENEFPLTFDRPSYVFDVSETRPGG